MWTWMAAAAYLASLTSASPTNLLAFSAFAPHDSGCIYSQWTQWSPCSGACETPGFSSRTRVILSEGYGYGHGKCDTGKLEEWRDCLGEACPRDCVMSEWGGWGACSAQCGPGFRHRQRTKIADAVAGGAPCDFAEQVEECNEGVCSADCVQGEWTSWAPCSAQCGPGQTDRSRVVLSDAIGLGKPCGPAQEWAACDNGPCARDCVMGDWAAWGACSTPCGPGTRQRFRSILSDAIAGGAPCGVLDEVEACTNGICSVDCLQSPWTPWSACSAACGPGTRDRSRSIITNPVGSGIPCGPAQEWAACDNGPCARDCVMADWGAWGPCSAQCGPGTRHRNRGIISDAVAGGVPCGVLDEIEACDAGVCSVDCLQSPWSPWSACSSQCGPGTRDRSRSIIANPVGLGKPCGPAQEWAACDNGPCARDCVMGDWGAWGACSAQCGPGSRQRTRGVLSDAVAGGAPCGVLDEIEACDAGVCSADCLQSPWSPWSACSSQCGPGSQYRSRSIIANPVGFGQPCGPAHESQPCDNTPVQTPAIFPVKSPVFAAPAPHSSVFAAPAPHASVFAAPAKSPISVFAAPAKSPVFSPVPHSSVFAAPSKAPVFAAPAKAPVFAAPAKAPIFAAPSKSPVFAAPVTRPVFAAPAKSPVFAAAPHSSLFAAPVKAPIVNTPSKTIVLSPAKTPTTLPVLSPVSSSLLTFG